MKKFLLVLPILLFSEIFAFADTPLTIDESASSLKFRFSAPDVQMKRDGNSKRYALSAFGQENFLRTKSGNQFQELRFLIAVPEGEEIRPRLNILRSRSLAPGKVSGENTVPSVRVEYAAMVRGVRLLSLVFQPFAQRSGKTAVTVADSAEIEIRFSRPLAHFSRTETRDEIFAAVENRKQLGALIRAVASGRVSKREDRRLLEGGNSWYKPDLHYVRVSTTRDGIARIKASDIVAADNFFDGKENTYLQLWFKGREYPMSILDDGDGRVSGNDIYYFAGRRAEGDSTWYDVETNEAVFYLAYAPGSAPLRLDSFEEIGGNAPSLDKVYARVHVEEDSVYSWGDEPIGGNPDIERAKTIYRTEEVPGEGWYRHLFSSPRQDITFTRVLTPYYSDTDSIDFRLRYHGGSDNAEYSPNHGLDLVLSNVPKGKYSFSGYATDDIHLRLPAREFVAGLNKVHALSVKPEADQPDYTNLVYLDYFSYAGAFRPYAFRGAAAFETGNQPANFRLSVPGFSRPVVSFLDTAQNRISFRTTEPGTGIRVGTKSGGGAFTSFVVNDSVITPLFNRDSTRGLHVVILQAPAYSSLIHYSGVGGADILSLLRDQGTKTGSVVVIAYNGGMALTGALRDSLLNWGAVKLGSHQDGEDYVCSFLKDDKGSFRELMGVGSASLAEFYPHEGEKSFRAEMTLPPGEYKFYCADENGMEHAKIAAVSPSNLSDPSVETELLIIAHKNFLEEAQRLAAYRAQRHKIRARVVDVENIYKEFGYGRHSAHAIKNFIRHGSETWQNGGARYLLLFGDASRDPRFAQALPKSVQVDYVPSFGRPVSDHWFGVLDETPGALPLSSVMTGRLPVHSAEQAKKMVDKLIEYDGLPPQPWMKNFYFIAGGSRIDEADVFCSEGDQLTEYIENTANNLNGRQLNSCKEKFYDPNVSNTQARDIISQINEGVAWVNFIGHGAPNTMDVEGWQAENLNNAGRYFLLTTFSCQTGAFAEPEFASLNEDYVLAERRGAIGSIGTTGFGYTSFDPYLREMLFKAISSKRIRSFGEMMQYMKQEGYKSGGARPEGYNGIMQYTLIGDPLSRLPIDTLPDLYVQSSEIKIQLSSRSRFVTSDQAEAKFSFVMRNGGDFSREKVDAIVIDEYNGRQDTVARLSINEGQGLLHTKSFSVPVKNKSGQHKLTVILDPANLISENRKENNRAEFPFSVYEPGLLALEPQPFWNVKADKPVFRVINPFAVSSTFEYEFRIADQADTATAIESAKFTGSEFREYVEWKSNAMLDTGRSYILLARQTDLSAGLTSSWLSVPFTASAKGINARAEWKLHKAEHFETNRFMENMAADAATNSLVLKKTALDAYILSTAGTEDINNLYSAVNVGNDVVVQYRTDNFGTNVVVYSPFDFSVRRKRRYDTQQYPNTFGSHNGKSDKLLAFLRDSVQNGEYVLIAFCGDALGGPIHNEKNIEEIRSVLRGMGSLLADSLTKERISFAMIGRKGAAPGTIPERMKSNGDSVELRSSMIFSADTGRVETQWIGPAAKWSSLTIAGDIPAGHVVSSIRLYGVKNPSLEEKELFSGEKLPQGFLDTLSAKDYPYLRFVYGMRNTFAGAEPAIRELSAVYEPAPELALAGNATKALDSALLQGDSARLYYSVRNLSLRSDAPAGVLRARILKPAGESELTLSMPPLAADRDFSDSLAIETGTGTTQGAYSVQYLADALGDRNELYLFNNSGQSDYKVISDTIAPSVIIIVDGDTVGTRTKIKTRINPLVRIIVMDNSRLPLDSTRLRFRMFTGNGIFENSAREEFSSILFRPLVSAGLQRVEARAEQVFEPILTPGENILEIREVSDASGNTWKMSKESVLILEVDSDTKLTEDGAYPNPFDPTGGQVRISFDYISIINNVPAEIAIFSAQGRMVKSFSVNAVVGKNEVFWDGRDESGSSVSSGIYYYRMTLSGEVEMRSELGRIVIVR